MNRLDIVRNLCSKVDSLSYDDASRSVDSIISLISESLSKSDRIEVRNFGTFSIRKRDQRISRNPKTGTSVLVAAKYHPYFRASKLLKESLNK
tara:strand:- start:247 stop:525 length:279 start_codon:yes stop_codon:yes gene_type:complete